MIKKLIILVIFLLTPAVGFAEDIYYSEAGTVGDTGANCRFQWIARKAPFKPIAYALGGHILMPARAVHLPIVVDPVQNQVLRRPLVIST